MMHCGLCTTSLDLLSPTSQPLPPSSVQMYANSALTANTNVYTHLFMSCCTQTLCMMYMLASIEPLHVHGHSMQPMTSLMNLTCSCAAQLIFSFKVSSKHQGRQGCNNHKQLGFSVCSLCVSSIWVHAVSCHTGISLEPGLQSGHACSCLHAFA